MINKYSKLAIVGTRIGKKKILTEEELILLEKTKNLLYPIIDRFHKKYPIELIISGGATGIDTLAANWAEDNGISAHIIRPNWYPNGREKPMFKGAGFVRNKLIIEAADYVIAMTTGSNGTANSIEWAIKLNRPLCVFDFEGKLIQKVNV